MPRTREPTTWKRLVAASACIATFFCGSAPLTDAIISFPKLSPARALQTEMPDGFDLSLQGVAMQLESGDRKKRREAMIIISGYPNHIRNSAILMHLTVPRLSKLILEGKPSEQDLAIWTLEGLRCPAAVPAFIEALRSPNTFVQLRAAVALGELQDPRAFHQLTVALNSDDHEVRGKSAWALGNLGDPRASLALIVALEDRNPDVRGEATRALGRLGKRNPKNPSVAKAVPPLIGLLEDDPDPQVRIYAAWSLGELGDLRAIYSLIDAADNEEDHHGILRAQSAEALGKLKDARVLPLLLKALQAEDHVVRIYSSRGLGFLGDKRAVPALARAAAKDEDAEVRASAKKAMDEISKPDPKEENPKKD